jgi:hypothetical protein
MFAAKNRAVALSTKTGSKKLLPLTYLCRGNTQFSDICLQMNLNFLALQIRDC